MRMIKDSLNYVLIVTLITACQFGGDEFEINPSEISSNEGGALQVGGEESSGGFRETSGESVGDHSETPPSRDELFRAPEPWEQSPTPRYRFRSSETDIEVITPGQPDTWQRFPIHGINVSFALPGTRPGEFTVSEAQVTAWLEELSELSLNTLRIYTVQSPVFYRALRLWNLAHPHQPFFLLQGIWIREPEEETEALDYRSEENRVWVRDEIEKVVDVIYGQLEIPAPTPERGGYGRAYGSYHADVSPWLVGWLLGREMEPYTIEETHARHRGVSRYTGALVSLPLGNPTEALIAEYLDYLLSYQLEGYQEVSTFAFSNWPTLDPLSHYTEPVFPISSEDHFTIDIELFVLEGEARAAGQFASYHAYPYYPDFIMYQPDYQIEDELGINPYLAYLLQLRSHHMGRPLVITEIGLPSSQGSAHLNKSGLHHGGLTERQVGSGLKRLIANFEEAELAGYCLFELLDEWFKRAWVMDRLELPADRRHLWYNPMSPEQNFGIIALAPGPDPSEGGHLVDGRESANEWPEPQTQASPDSRATRERSPGALRDLTLHHDEGYLHIRLRVEPFESADLEEGWGRHDYWVVFDTIDPSRGDTCLEPSCVVKIDQGVEFKLIIENPERALWLVDRPYDLFGIWHNIREPWQVWRSVDNNQGEFVLHHTLTNVEYSYEGVTLSPELTQETGWLPTGDMTRVDARTNVATASELGVIEARIPWSLLAFTDPTQRRVVDDLGSGRRVPDTSISGGIRAWALHLNERSEGTDLEPGRARLSVDSEALEREEAELVLSDSLPMFMMREGRVHLPEQRFTYRWETWEKPRWHMRRKLTWSSLVELGVKYPDTVIY